MTLNWRTSALPSGNEIGFAHKTPSIGIVLRPSAGRHHPCVRTEVETTAKVRIAEYATLWRVRPWLPVKPVYSWIRIQVEAAV